MRDATSWREGGWKDGFDVAESEIDELLEIKSGDREV